MKYKQTVVVLKLGSSLSHFFSAHSQTLNAIRQKYAMDGIAPAIAGALRWRSRCIMDLFENATLEK